MARGDLVANVVANTRQFGPGLRGARAELQSFVRGARSTLLPLAGIIAGAISTRESISAARTQMGEERKLEAVLAATGNAAQLSAQQIKDFAASRQDITNFGDEVTIAGASVLATFKQIKGSTFTDAISVAQDMSAVMGSDLQGSIVQVGKALNDPIQGMSALSKVGVSFTEQQKEQIRTLQESGDILGAQGIILAELRSEFGGSAEAMADPLTQLHNLVGDLAENVGFVLLPSIRELYAGIKDGLGPLTANVDLFKDLGEWIASGVTFVVSYGKHIVAASGALGLIVIATNGARVATQAWAKGLLLVQALSGPKAWAVAAAGLGLYAGAVMALDYAWQDTEKSAKEAVESVEQLRGGKSVIAEVQGEVEGLTGSIQRQQMDVSALMRKYREGAGELAFELTEINRLLEEGSLTAKQAEWFSDRAVDQATHIKSRIRDIRDEITILKGEATQADIELGRMFEAGAPLSDIAAMQKLIQEREQLRREQEMARAQEAERQRLAAEMEREKRADQGPGIYDFVRGAQRRADSLIETLKTPKQKLNEDLAEYSALMNLGKLTQAQHDALVARRNRQFEDAEAPGEDSTLGADRPGPNTALAAGSAESLSILSRAMTGEGTLSVHERSARIQERIERHQARLEQLAERKARDLEKLANRRQKVVKF